ncbi:putative regulator of Ras-like GTPase activity, Roadblock/LC7/MglB family, partial [Candidatus Electrothrix marina]
FEMLSWNNVRLSMTKLSPPLPEPKIKSELMALLLEAAHRKDTAIEEKPLDLVKQEFIRIQQQQKKKQPQQKTPPPTGEKKMAGIKDLLKEMAGEMDGVLAIQVTGMDGITIALHNPTGTDVEAFSAKFAMVMKLVEKSVDSLKGMGDFEENLVQSQNAWILTRFITPQYYVGIAVSRDGTLGNVRLVAQRYLDQLRKSL